MKPRSAPHSRTAFFSTLSSTGWRSNVERLMILSTSLVAASRSSASSSRFFRSASGARARLARVVVFDLLERTLRPRRWVLLAFRDKVHLIALQPPMVAPGSRYSTAQVCKTPDPSWPCGRPRDRKKFSDSTWPERPRDHAIAAVESPAAFSTEGAWLCVVLPS